MTLLITRADVEKIFSVHRDEILTALLQQVEDGYREIANGTEVEHPRVYLRSKDDPQRRPPGLFSGSALLLRAGRMGTRLIALGGDVYADGDAILVLFDQLEKKCLAIVWDQVLHYYRSGTPAGVAARLLARPDAAAAGVIGSGGISEGTLAMVLHVRPSIKLVRVFSRSRENRERFATKMSRDTGCRVVAVDTAAEAATGADVVITGTDADQPVVPDDAIAPGTLVCAMARNELYHSTFQRGKIVLCSRVALDTLDPPLRDPMPESAIVGDLADLVSGKLKLGYDPGVLAILASGFPVAMWDVAAASAMLDIATKHGIGRAISLYD